MRAINAIQKSRLLAKIMNHGALPFNADRLSRTESRCFSCPTVSFKFRNASRYSNTLPHAYSGIVSMKPLRSLPCPSQPTSLNTVRFTNSTPIFDPTMRKLVSVTRSRESGVSADRIEVTGVLMPVYKTLHATYVHPAQAILLFSPRFGVTNVSTPNTANGTHSHRNHGRLLPHLLCVLSKTMPHTGASIASTRRAKKSIDPATAALMPYTSV